MPHKPPLVFVSSTIEDLKPERDAVRSVLEERLKYRAFLSEDEGAGWEASYDTCKRTLKSSDFVILLLGQRYGSQPPEHLFPFNGETSVTEGEFILARCYDRPLLPYIKEANEYEPRQQEFINTVKRFFEGHTVRTFSTREGLKGHLVKDIAALMAQLVRGEARPLKEEVPAIIECETPDQASRVASDALRWVLTKRPAPSLLLGGGRDCSAVYETFLKDSKPDSAANATFFTNYEFLGLSGTNGLARQQWFRNALFSRLDTRKGKSRGPRYKVHYVPGVLEKESLASTCLQYDALLEAHPPLLGLLSVSQFGEFAGICPDKCAGTDLTHQFTSALAISDKTAANFAAAPGVPMVVTVGAGNLLYNVQHLMVVLSDPAKKETLGKLLSGVTGLHFPPRVLRKHRSLIVVTTRDVAGRALGRVPADRKIRAKEFNPERDLK